MSRRFLIVLSILILAGCARHRASRGGVISQELPLTLDDLAEIRAGEENHKKVLEQYWIYQSPKLETYANAVTASIAEVSTRPHLPYHVEFLDDDEVNIFGGPGGYIYITRGMMNFVESESELAGIIAHEIGHISHHEYSVIPHQSKVKVVYSGLLKGSELAKDSIGTYGTAANYGLKGLAKAAPIVTGKFSEDLEIEADESAVKYLTAAGYDPQGYQKFIDRLSRVEMADVGRFVNYMNTHPPFQSRRTILNQRVAAAAVDTAKIEFKQDKLNEVRQTTVNAPTSIIFEPAFGVHHVDPMEVQQAEHGKDEKLPAPRKRWGWF